MRPACFRKTLMTRTMGLFDVHAHLTPLAMGLPRRLTSELGGDRERRVALSRPASDTESP